MKYYITAGPLIDFDSFEEALAFKTEHQIGGYIAEHDEHEDLWSDYLRFRP